MDAFFLAPAEGWGPFGPCFGDLWPPLPLPTRPFWQGHFSFQFIDWGQQGQGLPQQYPEGNY